MSGTEVVRSPATVVSTQMWDRERIELVKRTIAKGASDDELALFMQVVQRTGLDPFARQVYAIKRYDRRERRDVMAIQTSIDGYRLVAQRSADYAGQVGPHWCGDDAVWHDVWLDEALPKAARVGVLRRGFTEVLYAVALFSEYAATAKDRDTGDEYLTGQWKSMPVLMIAKCAEALALRRAFPQELANVYTEEEMGQAQRDAPSAPPLPPTEPTPLSSAVVARFLTACTEAKVNVGLVVREATSGRTSDPAEVLTSEMPMLTKAFNDAKERAAESDKPANNIRGEVTREEAEEQGLRPTVTNQGTGPPDASGSSTRDEGGETGSEEQFEFIVRHPATKAQVGKIKGEYARLGLGDDLRDSQLEMTRRIVGRDDIMSHNDLSMDDARSVLDALTRAQSIDDVKF